MELWLLAGQLSLIDFDPDFSSCGVSGMGDGTVVSGRPFGRCAMISFSDSLFIQNGTGRCQAFLCHQTEVWVHSLKLLLLTLMSA